MTEEVASAGGRGMGWLIWILVPIVSAGGGFAASQVIFSSSSTAASAPSPLAPPSTRESAYVPFGSIIVNLNEGRMNRYLNLTVTLQVRKSEQEQIIKLLETHRVVLKTWLLSYLSELSLEDIRGAAGQNRLRREIQAQFNAVLFTDGFDHIYDVLFEEFNVQ